MVASCGDEAVMLRPTEGAVREVRMTVVRLTREQEDIAQAAMASGRYSSPDEVIDAALKLLRSREEQRARFVQSLDDAEREADETGWFEIEQVAGEMDAVIAEAEARRAREGSR
jgi:antitoxin ParD1/3/4